MATVMLVLSVSPIPAPLAGSALIVPFGWRAVFVAATSRPCSASCSPPSSCRRPGRRSSG